MLELKRKGAAEELDVVIIIANGVAESREIRLSRNNLFVYS